jgi:hypothetical protein
MSKFIHALYRDQIPYDAALRVGAICKRLEPENISAKNPIIHQTERSITGISNPVPNVIANEHAVLLGCTFDTHLPWDRPAENTPDGSYALLRSDSNIVQIATDPSGSRPIWFYFDEDKFVCSNSQRAIIMYISSFERSELAISWLVSAGTIGPLQSWDRRIRKVGPNSSISLDKQKWTLKESGERAEFKCVNQNTAFHEENLRNALHNTFHGKWSCDPSKALILLSGGYDSRAILTMLHQASAEPFKLKTVTWGLQSERNTAGGDATVARMVAKSLGVSNEYLELDPREISTETVMRRFVAAAEGQVEHISGYIDGLELWKAIYESGLTCIVRGDEPFRRNSGATERTVRYSLGIGLTADYQNLPKIVSDCGLPPSTMPDFLQRQPSETIQTWSDRLNHEFRIPTVLAALSEIKAQYVEIINPLLSRSILYASRALPDSMRNGKTLFKEVTRHLGPNLPYATKNAIGTPEQILRSDAYIQFLQSRLLDSTSTTVFPAAVLRHIAQNLASHRTEAISAAKKPKPLISRLPLRIRNHIRSLVPQSISKETLALRVHIVDATLGLFQEDLRAMKDLNRTGG